MDADLAAFVAGLPRKYEPYVLRYRHKSGLSHAVKRINKVLGPDESLIVHTLKTCAVGRWKVMGLDMLTISKLAHHRSIETTRKHYDFFDTEKILGLMDGAVEGGRALFAQIGKSFPACSIGVRVAGRIHPLRVSLLQPVGRQFHGGII